MANVKTTPAQWIKAREYFEAGLSLSAIVEKTGISKTQLSRRSGIEGWSKGNEKEQLIQDAVRVAVAKGTLTEQALIVHTELVDERTKHIEFFTSVAIKNVKDAMTIPCENQNDFRARADTILKGREAVLGKSPDTAIQINNNSQQSTEKQVFSTDPIEAAKQYQRLMG